MTPLVALEAAGFATELELATELGLAADFVGDLRLVELLLLLLLLVLLELLEDEGRLLETVLTVSIPFRCLLPE